MGLVNQRTVSILVAGLLTACDGDRVNGPTPPTMSPPAATPDPAAVEYRLVGHVIDGDDLPVGDAEVTFPGSRTPQTIITDASGAYDVTIHLRQRGTTVRVRKRGYEDSVHWVAAEPGVVSSRDLRLHLIEPIDAGQSIHLSIRADDPGCGFELYICRRIRVRSSARGTLIAEAVADAATTQLGVVGADQEPGLSTTARVSISVLAGVASVINVVMFAGGAGPQGFTLSTTLEPE